ncbi:LpxL/LpxP family acyltransferase [Rheinheimera sp. SA_1]|uniref:LpxL/LpxP family acyltransferase n=1 Tax=Rheinheimera sp. SA_1 TaxID=1827365 RepID=UPI0009EE0285|nr:acetyltransferase [Rheinheimera sp. SA_1]
MKQFGVRKSEHWAQQQESGSYLGIRVLLLCYRLGGKFLILLALTPVLWYFVCTNQRARSASLDFLQKVHQFSGHVSPFAKMPGWLDAFRHFRCFALEALAKIDGWLGRIKPEQIQQQGPVHFADLIAEGRGGVLIGSHLGNQELCRAMATGKYQTKIHVLVFTRHAAAFNKALHQTNPQVEVNLIQVDTIDPMLVMQLKQYVEQNEFVVIVGDRISVSAPDKVLYAPFLGQDAPFAIGPWVLASVLECPVHLLFCVRQGQGYQLTLEFVAEQVVLPRKSRQQALQLYITEYAKVLERYALRYPLQWFNFYNFWQLPDTAAKDPAS